MKTPKLKLKRPQLSRKSSSKSMAGVKPPKFASDLYADLRDRRLLPLVALLLVAIVAAPILLSGGGGDEASAPSPPVATGTASASQASFAVVPAEPGLRAYRRRLGHRQARNPFRQPVQPSKPAASSSEGSSASPEGSATEAVGVEAEETAGSGGSQTKTEVVVQKKVLGYEIDVRSGFLDQAKKPHEGIEPTTKLPSPKNPVLVFTGLSKDKKQALFLMSSNVTAYYGKAQCAFEKQACQLIELKPGKSATFAYGYGEARYKLTLQRIVPVVDTREAQATIKTETGGSGNGGAGSGK